MALPARLGGLGLINSTAVADFEYEAPRQTTVPLVQAIDAQESSFTTDPTANNPAKAEISQGRTERQMDDTRKIYNLQQIDCSTVHVKKGT